MNPKIKEKWLNALRSDEYQQGTKILHSKNGDFCCLGVLTDLYIKEHNLQWDNISKHYSYLVYGGDCAYIPEDVRIWAGLEDADPKIGKFTCTQNNDGVCTTIKSFKEIADLIEQYL